MQEKSIHLTGKYTREVQQEKKVVLLDLRELSVGKRMSLN